MATCRTCPHACALTEGELGKCGARIAHAGDVVAQGSLDAGDAGAHAGRITSIALDPVEKKPLARFMSGKTVLSLGGYGCNMDCPFCQNASIARAGEEDVEWRVMLPREVVDLALDLQSRRCVGIAFTYNEPFVSWEFMRDTARLAHEAGLVNVLVSNGMATSVVLDEVAPLIDAANIDLKCFTEEGYRSLGGHLGTVKRTIQRLVELPGCHVEVTTLVVPGLSDDEGQIDAMASWLASLDRAIPYHITRFFPRHRMRDAQPTDLANLKHLARTAAQHMDEVIIGNV